MGGARCRREFLLECLEFRSENEPTARHDAGHGVPDGVGVVTRDEREKGDGVSHAAGRPKPYHSASGGHKSEGTWRSGFPGKAGGLRLLNRELDAVIAGQGRTEVVDP